MMLSALLVPCLVNSAAVADSNTQAETPSAASAEPTRIVVTLVGHVGDHATLSDRISAWFDQTPVEFRRASQPKRELILGDGRADEIRVWLTQPEPNLARLYLVAGDEDGRALMRDIELAHGFDELGLEQVAQVVHSEALALWTGKAQTPRYQVEQQLAEELEPAIDSEPSARPKVASVQSGSSRASSRSTLPPEEAPMEPEPRDSHWQMSISAGYSGAWQGDVGWAHGPELEFSVGHVLGVGAYVRAHYWWPRSLRTQALLLDIEGGALRAGAVARADFDAWDFWAQVGFGADYVRVDPDGGGGELTPRAPTAQFRPALDVATGIGHELGSAWSLQALLRITGQVQDTHYDVVASEQTQTILDANQWEPGAAVRLEWRF